MELKEVDKTLKWPFPGIWSLQFSKNFCARLQPWWHLKVNLIKIIFPESALITTHCNIGVWGDRTPYVLFTAETPYVIALKYGY